MRDPSAKGIIRYPLSIYRARGNVVERLERSMERETQNGR